LLSRRRESGEPNLIATIRDVVEIVAIIAAGMWAFYVFVYENRIKPSFATPDINVTASMQRLSTHKGLIAVGLHVEYHNVGTVPARFLAVAVNVYGQRVAVQTPKPHKMKLGIDYDSSDYYGTDQRAAVYTWAYVNKPGNPSSTHETALDPGSTIENDRIFYVPRGRFDFLTLGIDAPYTKYDGTMPATLVFQRDGGIKVVTNFTPRMDQFNIRTVTSLDIR
jgi:hypothetical protein